MPYGYRSRFGIVPISGIDVPEMGRGSLSQYETCNEEERHDGFGILDVAALDHPKYLRERT